MNIHRFIQSNEKKWKSLEQFLSQASQVTLAKVPLEEFRLGSLQYRETLSDLAFARMRFPNHKVVGDLEQLVSRAHSVIYQARRVKRADWRTFWSSGWPRLVMECRKPILTAMLIFWVGAAVGFFMSSQFPILEAFFVSKQMRQAINSGHLWTESITSVAPQATQQIMTNNIAVSLLAWGLGVTFGVGTVWLMFYNGLMLGVIFLACLRTGMFLKIGEFIVAHGSLELPAIWIAGGAGLMIGEAMLFPQRYQRSVEMRLAGERSVRLVVGVIPMLIIAGIVEGFVSPSALPSSFKVLLAAALATLYSLYVIFGAREISGAREKSPA